MTDFQVGDRVRTIVGTVAEVKSCFKVAVDYGDGSGLAVYHTDYVELVERPRRKLRVGSVWECVGHKRYVHIGKDMLTDWLCTDPPVHRSLTTIDERPDLWREVPVEAAVSVLISFGALSDALAHGRKLESRGMRPDGIRPKSNGRMLDGRTWDEYPSGVTTRTDR